MSTYYITVCSPIGVYSYTVIGEIKRYTEGFYQLIDEKGEFFYFPIHFTIITTKKD